MSRTSRNSERTRKYLVTDGAGAITEMATEIPARKSHRKGAKVFFSVSEERVPKSQQKELPACQETEASTSNGTRCKGRNTLRCFDSQTENGVSSSNGPVARKAGVPESPRSTRSSVVSHRRMALCDATDPALKKRQTAARVFNKRF